MIKLSDKKPYFNQLLILILFIFLLMGIRGTGFEFLGSSMIGGMNYIQIFIAIIVVYNSNKIKLSDNEIKIAITGMCLFAILPFINDLLSNLNIFSSLIVSSTTVSKSDEVRQMMQAGINPAEKRWTDAYPAGIYLLSLALLSHKKNVKYLLFIISFGIGLLSGFRTFLFSYFVIILFYRMLSNSLKVKTFIYTILFTIIIIVFTNYFFIYMPFAVQRVFTFLYDGNNSKNYSALLDANGSTQWRLMLWELAGNLISKYWLIGKGLVVNYNDVINAYISDPTGITWGLESNNFHNGIISLFITMGSVGFAIVVSFLCKTSKYFLKIRKQLWNSLERENIYNVILANYFVAIITFFLVVGEIQYFLPSILFLMALLSVIANYNNKLRLRANEP